MIPLWFIVTILASFIWLLYESDWMRIRLPVGAIITAEPVKTIQLWQYKHNGKVGFSTFEPIGYVGEVSRSQKDTTISLFSAGIDQPVCGWDWLLSHAHPIAEYKITILAWNVRHHITLDGNNGNANLMKDICKFALKPNKEERKYINKQRKELKLARIGG